MNAITTAAAANPFLIKLEPGSYDVGSALVDKSYVDVQGSGRDITTITAGASGVTVSAHSFLRDVTVSTSGTTPVVDGVVLQGDASGVEDAAVQTSATGADSYSLAIEIGGTGSTTVARTKTSASTTSNQFAAGIFDDDASVTVNVRNSDFSADSSSGTAIGAWWTSVGTVDMRDSSATGSGVAPAYGLDTDSGTVTVADSSIVGLGANSAIATNGGTTHIVGSLVSSGRTITSGTLTCLNSYKADYTTATSSSCG